MCCTISAHHSDGAKHIMYSAEHIIEALRSARQEKRLSQRELSAKVGVPQSHISKIESGAVDLKLSSLIEIARALGLEPMLVPRSLLPAVEMLTRGAGKKEPRRPAYGFAEDDGDA